MATERRQPPLERAHLFLQLLVLQRQRLFAGRQVMIELPPVQANLLGLIDRADQQSNSNGEQLYFGERHLDVTRHDQSLIEHSIEYFNQTGRTPVTLTTQWRRHRLAILWDFRFCAMSTA